jgi:2-amino-4-hydroxy-6-hydroxymethyldihydropteridine diphosphokinase
MTEATLGLGSNIGDKRANITAAIEGLERGGVEVLARSHDYRTDPWGPVAQDWFINVCLRVRTDLAPERLLALCQQVERDLGRVREIRYGPRVIDIDILTYDDVEQDDPALTLPHPRLLERAFVLVPLLDVAPDLVVKGRRIADVLAEVGGDGVTRID